MRKLLLLSMVVGLLLLVGSSSVEARYNTTETLLETQTVDGNVFNETVYDAALGTHLSLGIVLSVSENIYVIANALVDGSATSSGVFYVIEDLTASGGTLMTPINLNRRSTKTSPITGRTSPTFQILGSVHSSATTIYEQLITRDSTDNAISFLIGPNTDGTDRIYGIYVASRSDGSEPAAVDLKFYKR